MKNPELYNKTVEILVQSYLNDTLRHLNCYACAVGNLVAHYCNKIFVKQNPLFLPQSFDEELKWDGYAGYGVKVPRDTYKTGGTWYEQLWKKEEDLHGEPKEQLQSTGYALAELRQIEEAFESCALDDFNDDDKRMWTGLMAVIDILDQIHENTDSAVTEKSKALFVKA